MEETSWTQKKANSSTSGMTTGVDILQHTCSAGSGTYEDIPRMTKVVWEEDTDQHCRGCGGLEAGQDKHVDAHVPGCEAGETGSLTFFVLLQLVETLPKRWLHVVLRREGNGW